MNRRAFMTLVGGLTLLSGAANGDEGDSGFQPDIEQSDHDGTVRADCGEVSVGGMGAEVFVPPTDGTVSIRSDQPADKDQGMVKVTVSSEERGLTVTLYQTPAQAVNIARRLEAAASVASGGKEP